MNGVQKALAFVATLLVGVSFAADPITTAEQKQPARIVASPATVVEQPKPGVPVPCDVGKFIFLELTGYRGDVSWDFSASGIVALLPDAPAGATAEYYPGIKQGESAPVWHKLPSKTSVPCLGVKEGTVTISAWVVVENRAKKAAEITVQVGNGPRPPPDEIKPPPKPVVLSEFEKQVVDAAKLESDRSLLPGLARTYQAGVEATATANTWGTLFLAMQEVATRERVAGTLPFVQTVIERELAKSLPTTGASNIVMTVADRAKAKKVFTEVAEAIEKAAKQP